MADALVVLVQGLIASGVLIPTCHCLHPRDAHGHENEERSRVCRDCRRVGAGYGAAHEYYPLYQLNDEFQALIDPDDPVHPPNRRSNRT